MNDQGQRTPSGDDAEARRGVEAARATAAGDPVLPPVRPPAGSFIVQLFLIPLLIVGCIVGVWLAFSWLAHQGSRPAELVRDLDRMDPYGWQRALNLANMLRDAENPTLRRDGKLAQQLADVLVREMDRGSMTEDHIGLRIYLCRALGEFERTEGLDALLTAAETERDPVELAVRRAALQALAVMCERVPPEQLLAHARVMSVLERASRDRSDGVEQEVARAHIRQSAAFVLGFLSDPRAVDLLIAQRGDRHFIVRANANIGLARQGDERAIPSLVEMLDPEVQQHSELDKGADEMAFTRVLVHRTTLLACQSYQQKHPDANLSSLASAIQKLLDSKPEPMVRLLAEETLACLNPSHTQPESESIHGRN